ncbi:hypothetical protein NAL32_15490 [Chryseobacterium sp. Ch-15]|uniref:Uncharacterized protein n=1 Tax=Chryseobacterium muglaense TaxID=2893752 RepID=A0A9Q3UTY2_9FLAO|nr:hypothetical protein [Chryseobacterium muglaense]MBD3905989.1 hypothetical protein [Chryseobacterium muglaense]MCC9035074.1 hypothetical protein [Chryseobacterium muglaense]MCM2555787.1 hypothetical protein [Chryseobacterium muglaense]
MKNLILLLFITVIINSCTEENSSLTTQQESINDLYDRFPMIKGDFKEIRKVVVDSVSITLLRNKSVEKYDYDEIMVFCKNKKFYSIPFFSNMYFDYWEFQNENQAQLYPKTNSTFNKELENVFKTLNLRDEESIHTTNELFLSVIHSEINLHSKPDIFKNYIYSTERVDRYKVEESDSCLNKTKKIFAKISKNAKNTIRYNQYFLDSSNGRVYEMINTSTQKKPFSFEIKTYRIDCFAYRLEI